MEKPRLEAAPNAQPEDSEPDLRRIIDSSAHAILVFECVRDTAAPANIVDFRCVLTNQKARHLMTSANVETQPDLYVSGLTRLGLAGYMDRYISVAELGETLDFDHVYTLDDHPPYWTHLIAAKFNDGFVLTLADISERRRMAQQIEEEHSELDRFFNVNLDLLCIANIDGYFIRLNDKWQEMLGYPLSELMGQSFLDFIHPEDIESTREALNQLRGQQSVFNFINRYRTRSGDYRYIEWRAHPVGDRIYSAARDITERLEIEHQLKESEARYRLLTELMSEYVMSVRVDSDERLTIEWIKGAFEKITTYPNDVYNKNPTWSMLYPEDADYVMRDIVRTVKGERTVSEYRIVNKNGDLVWLRLTRMPVWDEDRTRVIRFYSAAQDITEHKMLEQKQIESKLDRERVKMMSQFVGSVSHEFRTPLSIISSSAYLMTLYDEREQRELKRNNIEEQITLMTELVDMLLKSARLEMQPPVLTTVDVGLILKSVCEDRVSKIANKGLQILCDVSPNLPLLEGDSAYLFDGFKLILDNACQHTPDGEQVTLRAHADSETIIVEIEDRGEGISDEDQNHIFDTFWRKDTARSKPGFGLGLAIARKVFEMHRGRILVVSEPGQGSIFHIELPLR